MTPSSDTAIDFADNPRRMLLEIHRAPLRDAPGPGTPRRANAHLLAALTVFGLLGPACTPDLPPEERYVILPGQEQVVGALLGGERTLPGGCRLQGARIDRVRILSRYRCEGRAEELAVTLSHPALAPEAQLKTESFAVVVEGGAAPPGFPEALLAEVRSNEKRFRWKEPGDPTTALAITAAMSLVPPLLGAGIGRLVRRVSPRARLTMAKAAASLLLLILPALIAPSLVLLSVYDLWLVALLAAMGIWAGGRDRSLPRIPPAGPILAVVLTLAGVLGIELFLRRHPVPMRDTEPAGSLHLLFPPVDREHGCRALFPDVYDHDHFGDPGDPPFPPKAPGKRRILHLGDSMTAGIDVPRDARFPALLERARPGEEHINLGVLSIGTDAELVIARRWIDRLEGDELYLHVMPGNDIGDMDRPYVCCGDGPLLDYPPGGAPAERCAVPVYRFSLGSLLSQGPPPFPLRVLASYSVLFRRLRWGFQEHMPGVRSSHDQPSQWEHFERSLTAIRDLGRARNLPLTVVVMPSRTALEGRDLGAAPGARATPDRILAIASALGLHPLDAWARFEDELRQNPESPLFQSYPLNPHFEREGHRIYAEFLLAHREAR
jgi:hypothetical protein